VLAPRETGEPRRYSSAVPTSAEDPRLEVARRLLGNRLRDARLESGLSLADVAGEVGATAAAVSDWERGRRLPSLAALLSFADLYDQLVSELIDGIYPFATRRRPRRLPPPPPDGRGSPVR
jgi:DNA-binding transcriptional regulator YiaG